MKSEEVKGFEAYEAYHELASDGIYVATDCVPLDKAHGIYETFDSV